MRKFAILGMVLALVGCNSQPKPGVAMSPEQLSEFADVPLYPNASAPNGESKAPVSETVPENPDEPMKTSAQSADGVNLVPTKDDAGDTHYYMVLNSGDNPQTVANWYEKKLGFTAEGSNTNWNLMGRTPKGNDAMIAVYREGETTKISVRSIAHKK